MTTATARVYVGTYAKYNAGSIAGQWVNVEFFASEEDFYDECKRIHADETDPELMFQDWEGIPRGMVGESHIAPEFWEWLALDDDERELLAIFQEHVDQSGTLEQAQDAYMGQAESAEDWAEEFLSDTGALEAIPQNLRSYFDFAAYARDAGIDDVIFADVGLRSVYVFSRNY